MNTQKNQLKVLTERNSFHRKPQYHNLNAWHHIALSILQNYHLNL
jgi:hypothetical protein